MTDRMRLYVVYDGRFRSNLTSHMQHGRRRISLLIKLKNSSPATEHPGAEIGRGMVAIRSTVANGCSEAGIYPEENNVVRIEDLYPMTFCPPGYRHIYWMIGLLKSLVQS